MVAQDDGFSVTNALNDPRPFVGTDGDALEVVIGHHAVQLRAVEVALRQPAGQRGHRHARRGVRVHDAVRALHAVVNAAVQHVAGRVDGVLRLAQDVARQIDLDQVAGRHFAVVQAEGVDQEMLVAARGAFGYAQGDVVVDHLGPAEQREHAVAGGQLQACGALVGVAGVEQAHGQAFFRMASKSLAAWRSRRPPLRRFTSRPRCTPGRAATCFCQRSTFWYEAAPRNSAAL